MPDFVLIVSLIDVFFSITLVIGYVIGKHSRRAGFALLTTGPFLGVVAFVNYFEEVPGIVVATALTTSRAAGLFGVIEIVRKDVASKPG